MYSLCAMPFVLFRMLLFFSITSYPAENAYFNSPNRELSNGVWVVELYWKRNVYPSRSPCLETIDRNSFEHRNFLVLRLVPLKIAYFNSANRELSNGVQVMELYWNRNVYLSRSPCLETVDRKSFERRNFLVLRPVLPKIAYFNSANRQLSIDVQPKELR